MGNLEYIYIYIFRIYHKIDFFLCNYYNAKVSQTCTVIDQGSVVQFSAVQCSAVECSAVQLSAGQCSTM